MSAVLYSGPYDREQAVQYARMWAYDRNPAYYDFSNLGGDCTNFVSQCIFAGARQMNHTPTFGWYYSSSDDRSPSWRGVQYLYQFLVNNRGSGPFAQTADIMALEPGDVIQLGDRTGQFYHSLLVTGFSGQEILVATHSYDALDRPLSSYSFETARYLHLTGVQI